MKKIRMVKSIYDNSQAETIDGYYNDTSKRLTAFFFGNGHPFRERMRQKVFDDEIAIRRIRLIPVKIEEPPHAAGQEPVVYVHQLLLEIIMKDPVLEHDYADDGHYELQTHYLNAQLNQYINEQYFHAPTQDTDETARFLKYLAQYIPTIWDYFQIIEL